MILHALGDTIGFKNGEWEFNYGISGGEYTLDFLNELVYDFIDLGGVNSIDLSDWFVSDDTIFHMSMGESMKYYEGKMDDRMIGITKKFLAEALKICYVKSDDINRYVGNTTGESIEKFNDNTDARFLDYNNRAGGNGCAMRTLVIGLCLYMPDQLDELIDLSIISSQLTHNNAIGYLGGFAAAYLTSLAVQKVDIQKWPYLLLEQIKSDKIESFIKKKVSTETRDFIDYIAGWEKHIENRFDKNRKLIKTRSFANPMYRSRYYFDHFFDKDISSQIGDSGLSAMIMAYDAVIDSNGVWEKLIFYSMLHSGDSDTVGAIAGGLFGAYYGFSDVPEKMYEHLEYKDEMYEVIENIQKKYY
jgi:ADP-ribosylglycohydrolase